MWQIQRMAWMSLDRCPRLPTPYLFSLKCCMFAQQSAFISNLLRHRIFKPRDFLDRINCNFHLRWVSCLARNFATLFIGLTEKVIKPQIFIWLTKTRHCWRGWLNYHLLQAIPSNNNGHRAHESKFGRIEAWYCIDLNVAAAAVVMIDVAIEAAHTGIFAFPISFERGRSHSRHVNPPRDIPARITLRLVIPAGW